MKRNLNILKEKITLRKGIFYSMVEFFFSGITPSSTGGQPLQLYYMSKDKIVKKKSLITLLINTIYFKCIMVILGVGILIFERKILLHISPLFVFFYFVGIIVDLIMVIIGYLMLYKYDLLEKILKFIEKLIKKFKSNYEMKIDDNLELYSREVKTLNSHKKELILEFFITFIQRLCLFSMSYVVYKAFGLNEYSYFKIIIIQIAVQVSIEFIPIPGGTGVSEYLFSIYYMIAFSEDIAPAAMLVTRTFSFYIPLLVCGIVILFKYINSLIKKERY